MAPLADPECERNVLATMLRGGEGCYRALAALAGDDFAEPGHGGIYATIAALVADGRDVSYPVVRLAVPPDVRPVLDAVVDQGLATPSFVDAWVDRLLYLSRLRDLRAACHELAARLDEGVPEEGWLEEATERLSAPLAGRRRERIVIPPEEWPEELYREVCRRREESEQYRYLRWGLPEIERAVALQPKDMLILAAETGRGKTNMALGLCYALGVREKRPVMYVNTEMGREQVEMRLAAMGAGVSAHRQRTGMLSESDLAMIDRFRREAAQGNRLWITDAVGALSPERVIALARQYRAAGMQVLVVDYVQRLFGGRRTAEEKEWEILLSTVQRLKTLAQELSVVVIVVAQLSVEGYLARARQMAQEADAMVTLHHAEDLAPDERKRLPPEATHVARIRKSRHGPDRLEIGLRFDPERLTYEEVGKVRGRR